MTAARASIGNYCFRKSTHYILNKCKWLTSSKLIKYRCISFIHNIITHKSPKSILEIYKKNRFVRHKHDIAPNYVPKNIRYSKFFIYDHINTYNEIPIDIKDKSNKLFKKELRLWIQTQPEDTMD